MPGWRVGFCVGNREVIGALAKIKSYLDYGIFQPVQIASIIALNGPQDCVKETVTRYQRRRDVLVGGLNRIGWSVQKPRATMFVWARIPHPVSRHGLVGIFEVAVAVKLRLRCRRGSGSVKGAMNTYGLLSWKMNIGRGKRCAESKRRSSWTERLMAKSSHQRGHGRVWHGRAPASLKSCSTMPH